MSVNLRGKIIDITIPGYRIVRSIGKGGMATVYLAIQESFQREVALKIMSATLSEDSNFSERFLQEARIVSRLIHPNIVTVHDVGIHEGHHYLSMAYVPGHELKAKLNKLTGAEILRVVSDVAKALDYSGKKGYVHRDVKPENILLHEEDGHAVLMDFGIARAADVASSMTMTGMALGTPHYMSPEQARGKAVDPRSDLYSLGVLMYLMLAGAVPFEAETAVAIGIKHISEPIPRLPAPLAKFQPIISKLMAKKPENRFQSGAELIKALATLDPAEIDRWRERQAEKPVGRHNTPVRGVKKTTTAAAKTARPRPASKASAEPVAAEALHIPSEDISARKQQQKQSYNFGLWSLALLLVLGAGAIAYKGLMDPDGYDSWLAALGLKESVVKEPALPDQLVELVEEAIVEPVLEPEPEAASETLSPLEQLLLQSRQLAAVVETDPGQAAELVALYGEILQLQFDQVEAVAGLAAMQQQSLAPVREELPGGDMDQAEQAMISALVLFPALVDDPVYQQLEQQIQSERGLNEQLLLAQQYLEQDKLMAPIGENARELFEAVLNEAPDNVTAIQGLEKIASRYHQLAMAAQQRGDYARAMGLVERGLSINDDDLALIALGDELREQLKLQQYISGLMAEAEKYKSQGIWFAQTDSAAQRYQQVLNVEPGQAQAGEGLQLLVGELARQVTVQLELRNLSDAAVLLEPALALLPANPTLLELSAQLQASQPKVSELAFSSSEDFAPEEVAEGKVRAGRTLYIRFQYSNFNPATTVLQAVLFDGSRSVQIAAVPVIVNGEQGSSSFRIDRPVEGFKEGGYHMDILLGGKRVVTRDFVVAPFE